MIADVVHSFSLGICQILSQFWVMMPGCGRGLQDSSALTVERDIDVIYCAYIYTYSWGFEAIIVLSLLKRIRYFTNTMLANPIPFLSMVYNSPKWWKFCVKRE